jgi:hypothetical protein
MARNKFTLTRPSVPQESQIDGNQRHVPKVTSAKAVHLRLEQKVVDTVQKT